MNAFEKLFFLWTAAGLAAYFAKKYILVPHWNLRNFITTSLKPMINATVITVIMAYFIPDLIMIAPEKLELQDIAAKSPRLVEKITLTFGLVLGYTGGSVGYDLMGVLFGLPVIGPMLKNVVDRLKGEGDGN
jgi:hypothetical protein